MPSGKLGMVLIIVGVILLVIGLLFAFVLGGASADYTEDDYEDAADEIAKMSKGEEFTVLYEDVNSTLADGLNLLFGSGSVSEGDTVVVTFEIGDYGPEPKSAEVTSGGSFMIGLVLLIIGIVLMLVGIMMKMKAKKAPEQAPPPGGAPPPPPAPPQY